MWSKSLVKGGRRGVLVDLVDEGVDDEDEWPRHSVLREGVRDGSTPPVEDLALRLVAEDGIVGELVEKPEDRQALVGPRLRLPLSASGSSVVGWKLTVTQVEEGGEAGMACAAFSRPKGLTASGKGAVTLHGCKEHAESCRCCFLVALEDVPKVETTEVADEKAALSRVGFEATLQDVGGGEGGGQSTGEGSALALDQLRPRSRRGGLGRTGPIRRAIPRRRLEGGDGLKVAGGKGGVRSESIQHGEAGRGGKRRSEERTSGVEGSEKGAHRRRGTVRRLEMDGRLRGDGPRGGHGRRRLRRSKGRHGEGSRRRRARNRSRMPGVGVTATPTSSRRLFAEASESRSSLLLSSRAAPGGEGSAGFEALLGE